ncbi:hypothetical protein [Pseudomonas putida]
MMTEERTDNLFRIGFTSSRMGVSGKYPYWNRQEYGAYLDGWLAGARTR